LCFPPGLLDCLGSGCQACSKMEDKSATVQLPAWAPQHEQQMWGNRTPPILMTPGCVALPRSSPASGELLSTGVATPSAESPLRSLPRFSQPQFDGQQPKLLLSTEEPLEEDQGPHTRKFNYSPGQLLQQTARLRPGGAVGSSRSEATTTVTSPASSEEIECCPQESKVTQQPPSMAVTVLAEAASLAAGHLQQAASTVAAEHLLGSPLMPTVGSSGHFAGACNPCAFAFKGCHSGIQCQFCHLCMRGEKKRRKKASKMIRQVCWTADGWPSPNKGWDSSTNS